MSRARFAPSRATGRAPTRSMIDGHSYEAASVVIAKGHYYGGRFVIAAGRASTHRSFTWRSSPGAGGSTSCDTLLRFRRTASPPAPASGWSWGGRSASTDQRARRPGRRRSRRGPAARRHHRAGADRPLALDAKWAELIEELPRADRPIEAQGVHRGSASRGNSSALQRRRAQILVEHARAARRRSRRSGPAPDRPRPARPRRALRACTSPNVSVRLGKTNTSAEA